MQRQVRVDGRQAVAIAGEEGLLRIAAPVQEAQRVLLQRRVDHALLAARGEDLRVEPEFLQRPRAQHCHIRA